MKKNLRWMLVVLASAVMAVGGIALAGCDKVLDHDHIWSAWEDTKPATCTEAGWHVRNCIDPNCSATEGEEVSAKGHTYDEGVFVSTNCEAGGVLRRTCTVCGNINEDTKVGAQEHTFVEKEVIKAATCKEAGSSKFVCSVCGKEEVQDVAQKEHDNQILEKKDATCTEEGHVKMKCKVCGEETTEYTDPLDHDWVTQGGTGTAATCTEKGVKTMVCVRCGKTENITTDALGHDYVVQETVYPDFDSDGHRTLVCQRAGCTDAQKDHTKTEILNKLIDGQEVEFTVQLYRNSGQKYTGTSERIAIVKKGNSDQEDQEVASGQYGAISGGVLKASIEVHRGDEFAVKITELPNGYTLNSNEEIIMEPGNPSADVYIKASLLKNDEKVAPRYEEGVVVSDFTYRTVKGEEITLSKLLETHKFVYVDMFYQGCYFCELTFKALNEVYDRWKNDFAFVMIADCQSGYNVSEEAIKKYSEDLKMPYYVVYDKDQYANTYNGKNSVMSSFLLKVICGGPMSGYPFSFIIDQEGAIARIHPGAFSNTSDNNEQKKLINAYLNETLTNYAIKSDKQEEEQVAPQETNGLETAMLRGDYLPVEGKRIK